MVLALAWIGDIVIDIHGVDTDALFNQTVTDLYKDCCNVTGTVHDVCNQILGAEAVQDCSSFEAFSAVVVQFLKPLLKWAAIFAAIVAVLEMFAFVAACCLIGAASRRKSRSFDTGYRARTKLTKE